MNSFRARGDDEREMTSLELLNNRNGELFDTIDKNTNDAALHLRICLLYTSPSPRDATLSRMPSSA